MSDHLRPHDAALERLRALHPKKIDLSLGRMQRLCAALGHPERRLPPTVHVAGTNGKGSTVAVLRAIAEAAGLRVHVFTSPHLVRFAERIRLAGRLIEDARLAEVLAQVEDANAGAPITFFEITTAAALHAFATTPADLCLIEVGLGGLYDATNVIPTPRVAAIAPVDIDHREFLGDTLAQIAREKAGILKAGGRGVIARQAGEARETILARAAEVGASLIEAGVDFDAWREGDRLIVSLAGALGERLLDLPAPGLPGAHQTGNAALAVAAALALDDPRLDDAALAQGVAKARWPARMQRLRSGPLGRAAEAAGADLWLDGAHNPHAMRALAETLSGLKARDGRPVALILGVLANKDLAGMLQALRPLAPRLHTTGFEAEAAAAPESTAEAARTLGFAARPFADVTAALDAALAEPGPPPHVVIAGSLYLAGEVLALDPATWPD